MTAMETDPLIDEEEPYIFSKDRRNYSGECSSNENVTTYQHVNSDESRRIERSHLIQQSMPNLKHNGNIQYTSYGSLILPKQHSESVPLLGGNFQYNIGDRRYRYRYHRSQIFLFFYIVFYVAYLIMGSICFQRLERETEMDVRRSFRDAREVFLLEHPSVSGKTGCENGYATF